MAFNKETFWRNRRARLAALSPEEREAELAERSTWRSAVTRKGWRTRRLRRGLPPDTRMESSVEVRVFRADAEELRRLGGGDARAGLRRLLEDLKRRLLLQ